MLLTFSRSAVGLALSSLLATAAISQEPSPLELGRQLFERDWQAEGPLLARSDGLGPMHNAVSCRECHHQKGVGGAGPNEHNVDMVALVAPRKKQSSAMLDKLQHNAEKLHPGFADSDSFTLHARHASQFDYLTFRNSLLDKLASPQAVQGKPVPGLGLVSVARLQRSTTALFGAGQIDLIPDAVLLALENEQQLLKGEISGRVCRDARGQVARFGWRGQTARLHEFVLGACANELGLQVPDHPQPRDSQNPAYLAPALDLSARQCEALTAFVASLPAPQPSAPQEEPQSANSREGRAVFYRIGCASCHVATVGSVQEIFSDLLLHDMGPGLADCVAAHPAPPVIKMKTQTISSGTGYHGASMFRMTPEVHIEHHCLVQEWRTPPLWGVADSAPYLHDGRAATLDQAIRLHGGEAETSGRQYASLAPADQSRVIEFLATLVAPAAAQQPAN